MDISREYFDLARRLAGFLSHKLSEKEQSDLDEWISESSSNKELFNKITDRKNRDEKKELFLSFDKNEGWKKVNIKIKSRQKKLLLRNVGKYAALLILLLGVGIFGYRYTDLFKVREIAIQADAGGTVRPNSAVLTMADGTDVRLDDNRELEEKDGTTVNIGLKELSYRNPDKDSTGMPVFNKIFVPRTGEYKLTLSDGTVIHMNSASSLRFPVQFDRDQRIVELEGEAYFEVSKDSKRPFIVKTSDVEIIVLGTSFNVCSYAEEPMVKTTLVEGRVKVHVNGRGLSEIMQPSEEVTYGKNTGKLTKEVVDVSFAMAWKEGKLRFKHKRLEEIMSIISRWYDTEIFYENSEVKDYCFGCNFDKYESVEPLLKILESTGKVQMVLKGKTIIVKKNRE